MESKSDKVMSYLSALPYNDSLMLALCHLIPRSYESHLSQPIYEEVEDLAQNSMLNGFGASFTLTAAYSNILVSEISQLCYKGIIRVIALGSSDGLSTLGSRINLLNQPIIVPVGSSALGRIFNVIGSTIDGLAKTIFIISQSSRQLTGE